MQKAASREGKIELGPQGLVITRLFDAPRELVFRAWTEPEHLAHWFGQPNGATMPVCSVDLRVGGFIHFKVVMPDGNFIWGKGQYQEIVPPERLVVTDWFADEAGNIVDPPPGLPRESVISATFIDVGGKTRVIVEHRGVERASEDNRKAYGQGWTESLDRLQARLEAMGE